MHKKTKFSLYAKKLELIDSPEMLIEGLMMVDVNPELKDKEVLDIILKRFDELVSQENDIRKLIRMYYKYKDESKLSFLIKSLKSTIDKRLMSKFDTIKPVLNMVSTVLASVYAVKRLVFGKK